MGGGKAGEAGERSTTYLLNAQLVDKANGTQHAQHAQQAQQAGASRPDQKESSATGAEQPQDLVGRLREMGTALTGALSAGVEGWMRRERSSSSARDGVALRGHRMGKPSKAGAVAAGKGEAKAAAATRDRPPGSEQAPPPPPPPPHRWIKECLRAHDFADRLAHSNRLHRRALAESMVERRASRVPCLLPAPLP